MPLEHSRSKAAFSRNVTAERRAGKPRDVALAIAYRIKREKAEGGAVDPPTPEAIRGALSETLIRRPGDDPVAELSAQARAPTFTSENAANLAMGLMGGPRLMPMRGVAAPTGIRAYHGSPYDFDRFELSKIGTGEGAQAYGHGLYFAENPKVAESYKLVNQPAYINHTSQITAQNAYDTAARTVRPGEDVMKATRDSLQRAHEMETNPAMKRRFIDALNNLPDLVGPSKVGRMYEVNIGAKPEQFLDWDRPVPSATAETIRSLKSSAVEVAEQRHGPKFLGQDLYKSFARDPRVANEVFQDAGIPGIRYRDQGSRNLQILGPSETTHGQWVVKQIPNGNVVYRGADEAAARAAFNPTSNYVVFDPGIVEIMRKYAIPGAAALGVAGARSDDGMAQGGSVVNARAHALDVAYRIKREGRAAGGPSPAPWQVRNAARSMTHSGPIMSAVAGRTDHHPMAVKSGAYVLPADHVSSLGQGNTASGMAVLGHMFGSSGPYGIGKNPAIKRGSGAPRAPRTKTFAEGGAPEDDVGAPVEINAAGGEFVIDPEIVAEIGGGDVQRGHEILDDWVVTNRRKHIKTLKKLPGPAKS